MSKNSLNVLGKKLAEKTGLSQQEAELFIKKVFDVVNEGLQDDKQVKVKWLGTFKVTSVKDRESVDVNTGERIVIDGRDKISFTPDNILKEIVNKPFAQFETVVVNDGVEFDEIDKKFEAEEQMNENRQVKESKEQMVENQQTEESEEQMNENQQTAEVEKPLNANPQGAEAEASDVIDFLDESDTSAVTDKTETLSVSNEVVVIGDSETSNAASSQTSNEASSQISNEAFPEIITETIVQNSVDEMKPVVNEPEEVQKEQEQVQAPEVQLKEDAQDEPEIQDKEDVLEEQKTRNEPETQNELKTQNEPEESEQDESEADAEIEPESYDTFESTKKGIVIPRYLVIVACFLMVALIGGIGWFAFNYGKMAAQRDHLALQLDSYQQDANKPKAASAPPSQEEIMRKKAIEDSIRMVKASEAVKMAEAEGKQIDENASLDVDKNKSEAGTKKQLETQKQAAAQKTAEAKKLMEAQKTAEAKKAAEAKKHAEDMKAAAAKKQAENASAKAASKYNQDARVRTGAYRIVGVAEVVTAREGQTIEAISKRYFGPGMECYVEALNGSGKLKAGQKVKIPKLELKKKK